MTVTTTTFASQCAECGAASVSRPRQQRFCSGRCAGLFNTRRQTVWARKAGREWPDYVATAIERNEQRSRERARQHERAAD